MLVVLDTNVVVSAILWKGRLAPLFELLNRRVLTPCFNPETVAELFRVADYPHIFKQSRRMGTDLKSVFARVVEAGIVVEDVKISETVPDDPSDEKFLACAVVARANFIISGDSHLLRLGMFRDIPILSP